MFSECRAPCIQWTHRLGLEDLVPFQKIVTFGGSPSWDAQTECFTFQRPLTLFLHHRSLRLSVRLFMQGQTLLAKVAACFWFVLSTTSLEVLFARLGWTAPSGRHAFRKNFSHHCSSAFFSSRRGRTPRLLWSWRKLQASVLAHFPLAFHCDQSPCFLLPLTDFPLLLLYNANAVLRWSDSRIRVLDKLSRTPSFCMSWVDSRTSKIRPIVRPNPWRHHHVKSHPSDQKSRMVSWMRGTRKHA